MSSSKKCCKAWSWIKPIIAGQVISILITGTSLCSEQIANIGIDLAMFQSFWNYFVLMFLFIVKVVKSGWKLKTSWWKYLIIAILDVEANFIVVKAYQYAHILSIMLMDSITIPVCMLFAFIFFKARFRWTHFVGVILCLVGLGIYIYYDIVKYNADASSNLVLFTLNNSSYPSLTDITETVNNITDPTLAPTTAPSVDMAVWGDVMAIGGAILYAISNLMQEYLVKSYDMYEFLSMMGLFGAIIAAIQIGFTEWNTIITTEWTGPIIGYFVGFAVLLVIMYLCTAYFMSIADATSFNLNLLTSDVYAAFAAFLIFGNIPAYVYYISLVLTILGLIFYYIYDYKSIFKNDVPIKSTEKVVTMTNSDNVKSTKV